MREPPTTDAQTPATGSSPIDWPSALEQHSGWLRTVVSCRTGDAQSMEDVLQDVAVAALTQDSRPSDPGKVAPWLYRVAVRQSILHRRRLGRRKRLMAAAGQARRGDQHCGDPLNWLLHEEARQAVTSALAELPQQDQEILLLKYTENWSYRQLAEHLGGGANSVEYRLLRAKRRLRRRLSDLCDVEKRDEERSG